MRPRNTQRRLGVVLMATALSGAVLTTAPALAQDGEQVEAPVEARALITYPANDAIPDTLLGQFPPQVVCVVVPECPPRVPGAGARADRRRAQGGRRQPGDLAPLQPANPVTVSYVGGAPRYASAVQVALPEVPAGEEVNEFVLSLPQGQPSFSFDSPLFRRVVLAAVATAGEQGPRGLPGADRQGPGGGARHPAAPRHRGLPADGAHPRRRGSAAVGARARDLRGERRRPARPGRGLPVRQQRHLRRGRRHLVLRPDLRGQGMDRRQPREPRDPAAADGCPEPRVR